MNYPAYLIPASIALWGWLNETWTAAAILLLMNGLSGVSQWRRPLSNRQFHRIGDFITIMVIVVLVLLYTVSTSGRSIFIILQWLPAFFAPALLAQLFSTRNDLPLGTLFYSFRKEPESDVTGIDFRLPYAGLCLLAAGAANVQTPLYFISLVLFVAWILWTARARTASLIAWFFVIAIAAGSAFQGYQALHRLQTALEQNVVDWLSGWTPDPFKSRISMGDIGRLKGSGRIEFRVKADTPLLLHQASYDRYLGTVWQSSLRSFKPGNFVDQSMPTDIKRLNILQTFKRRALLSLPAGTVRIDGLEGADILYNPLGAVKLYGAPDYAEYRVSYTGRHRSDVTHYELDIPAYHAAWLDRISKQLDLANKKPLQVARSIEQFFQTQYRYSLFQKTAGDADQALEEFMLTRKAGHCDYFAAASVLLLRHSGIPARLATGYSVQEYDPDERLFIVRRRHAHAWAMAHINGRWIDVDGTPSRWLEMEEQAADWMQPVDDWFSNLLFRFRQWRWQRANEEQNNSTWWITGILLLILYVAWRLFRSRSQWIKTGGNPCASERLTHPGTDSELYLIEQSLAHSEQARRNDESLLKWARRLSDPVLIGIVDVHYRYRFDPAGITGEQRTALGASCRKWLNDRSTKP